MITIDNRNCCNGARLVKTMLHNMEHNLIHIFAKMPCSPQHFVN